MDRGLTTRELAEKYSIPSGRIMARRRERRLKLAEMVLLQPSCGKGEEGHPTLSQLLPPTVAKKLAISAPPAPELPAPSELSETELVNLLSDPSAIHALPAAEAEKLFARRLQSLVAQGLADMRAPASPKELGPMAKLFREMSGLTGDKGKGSNGLLAPPRSFGRRPVAVIDVTPTKDLVEEPEGGWPDGME